MSFGNEDPFGSIIRTHLREAGLPGAPIEVIGRGYRFGCYHGSHHSILLGSIRAIEISDEVGLQLHVSSPTFFGRPLVCLMYEDKKWVAVIDTDANPQDRFFKGELRLI